jgi:chemotaxis protein MotB
MKKTYFALLPVILSAFLYSCAPLYYCGDPIPEKTPASSKKNMRAVVSERDSLCTNLALKEKENAGLQNTLAELTGQYNSLTEEKIDLEKRFRNLIDENLSNTDELNNKELLLTEREKTLRELQLVIARQDSITRRLNATLRNALLGFNSDELSVEIRNGKVYVSMSDKLLFKSGSSAVEAKGKEALKLLGEVLDKNLDIDILVEGHTDNVPIKTSIYKDNWDLSVARATSIVRILSNDYKIAPTRMTASGRGEFFPKADNETAEGRAMNRRTEIILSPKLDEVMQLLNDQG